MSTIAFRATEADRELVTKLAEPGETSSDVLRRALRVLDRERWHDAAQADADRIMAGGENLADEPDAW
jgi:antitoxin ParD1/3/4